GDVDFGQVPMDRQADGVARLHNISTEPMTIGSLGLDQASDVGFSLPPGVQPVTVLPDVLQAGEVRDFPVRFSPGHMGDATGTARFSLQSARHPSLDVPLHAFGGTAEV